MIISVHNKTFLTFRTALVAGVVMLGISACSSGSSDDGSPTLRLATVAVDSDNDGMPNDIITWVYDDDGRALAEDVDTGADGTVDARFGRVRDGESLRMQRDEGVDGTIEGETVFTVDANGLLESQTRAASDDGVAALSITYVVEDGRIVGENGDRGDDGTIDVVATFSYDDSGRLATGSFDFDGDGVADDTFRVVREDSGTVVRLEEDFGNDGGVDFVRILTYEEGACDDGDIANLANPVFDVCL